jgi:hypothetical protein
VFPGVSAIDALAPIDGVVKESEEDPPAGDSVQEPASLKDSLD